MLKMNLTTFIIITDRCNLHCKYCSNEGSGSINTYDFTKQEDDLQYLKSQGVTELVITGGEPFHLSIKQKTLNFIFYAKSLGFDIYINSNCIEIDNETAKQLKINGIKRVFGSLDSMDIKENNIVRGKTERVIEGIKCLINNNVPTSIISVINKINHKSINKTSKKLTALGIKEHIAQPIHLNKSSPLYNELALETLSKNEYSKAIKNMVKINIENKNQEYAKLLEYLYLHKPLQSQPHCKMGESFFVITPSRDIKMCFSKELISNLDNKPKLKEIMTKKDKGLPSCFGKHCVSLFVIKYFWDEQK